MRVPVSGQVMIDGEPLRHGSIMFVPSSGRPAGGTIRSDGQFTLTTYEPADGAVPGVYKVKLIAIESISERANRWHAPKRYSDINTSGLQVEITGPKDDLVIELTWDGGTPFVHQW